MNIHTQQNAPCVDQIRTSQSDEELFQQYCIHGEQTAFNELVYRYEKALFGYLVRYLHSAEMAEDVCQATFAQIHRKRHHFRGRHFRSWLYSTATNQAIDLLRQRRRRRILSLDSASRADENAVSRWGDRLEAATPTPFAQAEADEQRRWLRRAIDKLPECQRAVLLLTYFHGRKYEDVAAILQVPVGTVKSRIHSAVKKLYRAWWDEESCGRCFSPADH